MQVLRSGDNRLARLQATPGGNRAVDPTGQTLITCAAATAVLVTLWLKRPAVRGTTLLAVAWWHAVATLSLVAAAGISWLAREPSLFTTAGPPRYVAGVATLCPMMALLGAKRPQSRAWSAIVAALWLILALPGIGAELYGHHDALTIDSLRSAFLMVLVVIGVVNALPTRAAPAYFLQGCGQFLLLAPYLPRDPFPEGSALPGLLGVMFFATGVVAWLPGGAPRPRASRPLNHAWLDFRDAFGLVWAARVLDRFNQESLRHGWKFRLTWSGLRPIGGTANGCELSPQVDQQMRRLLRSLLRRFVSRQWIEERLPTTLPG